MNEENQEGAAGARTRTSRLTLRWNANFHLATFLFRRQCSCSSVGSLCRIPQEPTDRKTDCSLKNLAIAFPAFFYRFVTTISYELLKWLKNSGWFTSPEIISTGCENNRNEIKDARILLSRRKTNADENRFCHQPFVVSRNKLPFLAITLEKFLRLFL